MDAILDILTTILLLSGCFFSLTGAVGVLRMPDFYSRIHPAGKSDTLAQFLIILGLILQAPDFAIRCKLILITLFLFVTAPVATHAITQAAHLAGLKPWRKEEAVDG